MHILLTGSSGFIWFHTALSLYAATKKSNELIAHSYSHIYGLSTIGLRFFTVYGPYGRPDMALFKFAGKMLKQEEIEVYNFWNMQRDFTYIDDIVEWIIKSLEYDSPYEIFNLGNNLPEKLEDMIGYLEKYLKIPAMKKYLPLQDGDVLSTWADIEDTKKKLNWEPKTSLEVGVESFCDRYKQYYKL